jgi:hypothetical protein
MTEEFFRHPMVEIGHGHPLAAVVPAASRAKSMDMGMKSRRFAESLDDRDHSWAKAPFFECGSVHELSYRLVGTTGELAQELAVVKEIHSEHLRDRENPHRVRHVLQHFVVEERGESGGSFGIA